MITAGKACGDATGILFENFVTSVYRVEGWGADDAGDGAETSYGIGDVVCRHFCGIFAGTVVIFTSGYWGDGGG